MSASTIHKIYVMNEKALDSSKIELSNKFFNDLRSSGRSDDRPLIDFCEKTYSEIAACIESIGEIKHKRAEIALKKSIAKMNNEFVDHENN